MLTKISIKNFKSLRDVQIDLERFTVLVGPNASGKSSILQAIDWLCRAYRVDHPHNSEGELLSLLTRGATEPIELAVKAGGKAYRYRTRPTRSPNTPLHVHQAALIKEGRSVAAQLLATDWKTWSPEPPVPAPLPQSVVLRLEASKIVQPGPAPGDPTVMSPDGSGLHTALASMALNDPDSWQALQANLRRIIPTIRRLRHTKTANMHQPAALLFDTIGADSLPADQVSEGTILVLGLLAALHASDRPSLMLLDDLDRGLHPKAQRELVGLLRGVLESNPDLQIVATTHSPYLLGSMEPNEVRMTYLNDAGATACDSLTHHPQYAKWKDEMSAGEMWSLFGEKWVVGQEVPA